MLTENVPFQIRRGSQTLTVSALNESFAGFINGQFYIVAKTPDAVVRHFINGPRRNQPMNNSDSSKLVQAAREAAGDADEDTRRMKNGEKKAMNEVAREASRPSKSDIEEAAKKLLDHR